MNLLNFICWCSTFVLSSVGLVLASVLFFTSIYTCFSKKVKDSLFIKILVAFAFGCFLPLLVRLVILCLEHMFFV